jgi:hypothetical protein
VCTVFLALLAVAIDDEVVEARADWSIIGHLHTGESVRK